MMGSHACVIARVHACTPVLWAGEYEVKDRQNAVALLRLLRGVVTVNKMTSTQHMCESLAVSWG